MDDLKKLEDEVLVLKLHQLLKEMRYLVVLDDIWETEVWDSFQSAFSSGRTGSKVMLTARNKDVALYADPISEALELVRNISSKKEHFGITTNREGSEGTIASANERLLWWRQTSPNIEEDDLVDLVEDTKALLRQLSRMEPRHRVVSIVGMGCLGKTTLAKKLYNHSDIKYQFDCKAFVYVSKDYSGETLERIIVTTSPDCNMDDLKKLEDEVLVLKLHQLLKEMRYLVVLDDIWETEVWDSFQSAFSSGRTGSKVMLTTRNKDVALYAEPISEALEL
ncbi:unnamed protein product [Prunus armeniaca]